MVAWIQPRDASHHRCVEYLRTAHDEFLTTEAVLTEAMHLMPGSRDRAACFGLLRALNVRFVAVTGEGLLRANALMQQYADLPMDYADASLIVAGERLGLDTVLTLDEADFRVYRLDGRRPFRFVLG